MENFHDLCPGQRRHPSPFANLQSRRQVYIRNWLVLAQIAIDGDPGASQIDKDFLKGEAAIKPKADDKVTVGGKELDLEGASDLELLHRFPAVVWQRAWGIRGRVRGRLCRCGQANEGDAGAQTNDQGKAWLNGQQVFKFAERARSRRIPTRSRSRWRRARTCWCSRSSTKWTTGRPTPFPERRRAGQEPQGLARAPVGIARGVLIVRRTLRARLTALVTDGNPLAARGVNRRLGIG